MRYLYLFLLIPCFLILTGCESQKEIDNLVSEYVKKEFGIEEIEYIYRGKKNEGNMGDRSYIVKSKTEPSFEFSVYLEGMMKSEVVGDNYNQEAEAYQIGQNFSSTYQTNLNEIGYTDISFSGAQDRTSFTELEVNAKFNKTISLNNEQTIEELFKFIQLLQEYNQNLNKNNFLIQNLVVEYPVEDTNKSLAFYYNVVNITDYSVLTSFLLKDIPFVNEALLEKNRNAFIELEKEIRKIGFAFNDGLNDKSVFCNGEDLNGLECTGFTLRISGKDKSEKNIEALKEILNKSSVPISKVVIPKAGGALEIEVKY